MDYATCVCKEFGLLGESYFIIQLSSNDLFVCLSCTGSRGVSIIFASGDGGVGDGDPNPATHECFSNDGTKFELPILRPTARMSLHATTTSA